MDALNTSAIGSLLVQLITGLIETEGLVYRVKQEDLIVQDILGLELIVQGVEFIFYTFLVYKIITNNLKKNITSQRYIDWSITTPFMLISFILFFKYLKEPSRKIRIFESAKEEKTNIALILTANFVMLLFGYLAEIGVVDTPLAVAIGFLPFAFIFKILYSNYVTSKPLSLILFYFIFAIWGLYGVAAVLPFTTKNIFYNILDLFSKNAYGLFLFFYLQQRQI
jgi:bacteriorhodopsin